jgi:hypothetical protein
MRKMVLPLWTAAVLALSPAADAGPEQQIEPTLDIRHHDLDISILPDEHRLEGHDRVTFEAAERDMYFFYLGDVFEVTRARLDGKRVELKRVEIDYPEEQPGGAENKTEKEQPEFPHPDNRVMYGLPTVKPGEHILEIDYKGVVYDELRVPEGSRSDIPSETNGLVDTSGSYLSGWRTGWYPDGRDVYARFSIRVTTPPGFEAVTEGKLAHVQRSRRETVIDWEVAYPTQHVTLMAARYVVRQRDADGVTLMAYFFPSEEELIDTYLDASEEYVHLYNRLIGPYPFSKFAVVENFFPTGYGMPSYTLLGRRIVRMPFIVKTSLGHEVAHNWWGNCVYPDHESGNWCEGLATYYADYRYEKEKGDSAAAVYRRDILIDYATHVTDSTDIPLADFRSREDEVTGVIGYGKCTMVFHMLRNRVGEDKYYRSMRNFFHQNRFEVASWEDIEWAVEEVYGGPLDGYFGQWVHRPGAPRLSISDVKLEQDPDEGDHYTIRVTLANEGGYILSRVPVEIIGPTVTRRIAVAMTGRTAEFDWRLDERPIRLAVDPEYDIFRHLSPVEIPVTISGALAGGAALVVLPTGVSSDESEAYVELAERLAADEGTVIAYDTTLTSSDLVSREVFVLGGAPENGAWAWLDQPAGATLQGGELVVDGRRYSEPGHAAFVAFTSTVDSAHTVCAIVGNSAAAVRAAGYKVIYYGKYSYVTFRDGKKQAVGEFPPPPGPLVYTFDQQEEITEGE